MFSLGLEFSLRRVIQVAATSGLAALAETSVMLGVGFLAGQALGWTSTESVFVGAMVAISSTTIIAKAFAEHDVRGRVTEVVFGILIVEDLIAILLVAVLTALATGGGLSPSGLAVVSVRLITFLAALVGAGLLTIPRLVRAIVRGGRPETTLVAAIGICFAAALLALAFGYSVALGAFIAGTLVAESGEAQAIEPLVQPVRDLFVAIFFVAVGMLIDPRVFVDHWGAVLALVLVVIVGKVFAVTTGAFLTGNGLRPSVQAGMSLAQIGEFSFIIAGVGTVTGVIRPFLYPVAIVVSAVTTMTTPWLIAAAGPAALYVDRKLPKPVQTFVALYGSWVERLRGTKRVTGGRARIRQFVRLVVLDAVLLGFVIVGTAVEMGRFTVLFRKWTGVSDLVAQLVVVAGGLVIATPLVVGLVRTAWVLAFALAVRAIPAVQGARVDLSQAPRGAFVTTLQIAILLAVGAPLLAITQPFMRGLPSFVVLIAAAVVLAVIFWRSASDLYGHARAGAQVIVGALARQMAEDSAPEELTRTMEHMAVLLPGLGDPIPVVLSRYSSVVGKTLKQLNIRGLTGATVLGISRPSEEGEETLVPSGGERLRAGDVLALAGSQESVAAARKLLSPSGEGASQAGEAVRSGV